jgi:hypothetical protein
MAYEDGVFCNNTNTTATATATPTSNEPLGFIKGEEYHD